MHSEAAWIFEEHPRFWGGVAEFLRQLPLKSKEKIWSHATRSKKPDGKFEEKDVATRARQCEMLLIDTVLVYLKILYKGSTCPITKRHVSLLAKPMAPWLLDRCSRSLKRSQFFESDYVPQFLIEYQSMLDI